MSTREPASTQPAAHHADAHPTWVSPPDSTDQQILKATGRTWDEWVAFIDTGPGREASHRDIATWVNTNSEIGGWWAQMVTVGYERITGMRLPGQMPDGTFTVSRSRTIGTTPEQTRAIIEDDESRAALLPGLSATRTSKPGVKSPRYEITTTRDGTAMGSVLFNFDNAATGTRLTVSHEKINDPAATARWKQFWEDWLTALAAANPPA